MYYSQPLKERDSVLLGSVLFMCRLKKVQMNGEMDASTKDQGEIIVNQREIIVVNQGEI